ncbi:MAG: histidinol dehydrogenase [Chloroflexi bacterium]|nr:histidinol dehydrogenase [Chloroflexota bacterium]
MIPLYLDLETARKELSARRASASLELPAEMRARNQAVFGEDLTAVEVVQRIITDVQRTGDDALRRYAKAFEGVDLSDLEVSADEIEAASARVSPELRAALEIAAERIQRFHERSRRESWFDFAEGSTLGQLIVPLHRVGIYAPGGRAPYPSTVLMTAVPARVAGVDEVILVTPVGRDGRMSDAVLAAAQIARVHRVFRIGGAQAIAALAYGTETIPRVDKIVGPGNVFVVLAKQAVAGVVGIDGLPGPTETVIVADAHADPSWVAADMIAQAEHDPMAQSVLVCTDRAFAEAVLREIEPRVEEAERRDVITASFAARGAIVVAESVDAAIDFANDHAPEHVCLAVADPWSYVAKIRNAGGLFIGESSVEALGDYAAGPSHVMPTGGAAHFASALNLDDFTRVIPVFSYDPAVLRREAAAAIAIARAEGLTGHARAIEARLNSVTLPRAPGERA